MKDLLILGAGGHGKVVLDCALSTRQFNQIYFLDDRKVGEEILGHLVIDQISKIHLLRENYTCAIVAIGNNSYRLQLIEELLKAGYEVPYLIHPSAIVSKYSKIGEGSVVLPGAILNAGCEIGKGVIVNTGVIVEHDCSIADGVHLSPAAKMGGEVSIGEKSWICIGATIINQITIGTECTVAAGAVVINDIKDQVTVYGIPAKEKVKEWAKKIMILANNDIGLYKFRKELIASLIREGHEVYISLPDGQWIPELTEMGCKFLNTTIDRRGINPIKDLKLFLKYKKMMKNIRPDQVMSYTIKPNIYGGLVCRWMKINYSANITGLGTAFQKKGIIKKIITFLYKIALKKASYVFFENEENKRVFVEESIIPADKGKVMKGAGVNIEEYSFEMLPNQEQIRFLFIGRIMKEKGIDELFIVAQKIREVYTHVVFDIVGPFEEDYEAVVKEMQQKNVINYYGYQKDVKPFITKADCFILPSYHEGMANTLLEAAAMGRPIITSDIHGCKEVVNNNGYLVKVKDALDLYEKVEAFIKLSLEERQEMGNWSRKHIENVFDKKKVVAKTLEYIHHLGGSV